jgi:hypothetical protein
MKKLFVFLLSVALFAGFRGCAGTVPTHELPDQGAANQQERNAGL